MKQRKIGWCATKFERFTYVLFFVGQLIFNTLVGSFILTYLLNLGVNEVDVYKRQLLILLMFPV